MIQLFCLLYWLMLYFVVTAGVDQGRTLVAGQGHAVEVGAGAVAGHVEVAGAEVGQGHIRRRDRGQDHQRDRGHGQDRGQTRQTKT